MLPVAIAFGQRYLKPKVSQAVVASVEIAKRHQLSLWERVKT
ncbi:hypothetical protein [Nostoc commune]|nr:hypothetical protein [Nostoc commune]